MKDFLYNELVDQQAMISEFKQKRMREEYECIYASKRKANMADFLKGKYRKHFHLYVTLFDDTLILRFVNKTKFRYNSTLILRPANTEDGKFNHVSLHYLIEKQKDATKRYFR